MPDTDEPIDRDFLYLLRLAGQCFKGSSYFRPSCGAYPALNELHIQVFWAKPLTPKVNEGTVVVAALLKYLAAESAGKEGGYFSGIEDVTLQLRSDGEPAIHVMINGAWHAITAPADANTHDMPLNRVSERALESLIAKLTAEYMGENPYLARFNDGIRQMAAKLEDELEQHTIRNYNIVQMRMQCMTLLETGDVNPEIPFRNAQNQLVACPDFATLVSFVGGLPAVFEHLEGTVKEFSGAAKKSGIDERVGKLLGNPRGQEIAVHLYGVRGEEEYTLGQLAEKTLAAEAFVDREVAAARERLRGGNGEGWRPFGLLRNWLSGGDEGRGRR